MNKWQYKFVYPEETYNLEHHKSYFEYPGESTFNELGDEAWELVSCKLNDDGEVIIAIFKRPGRSLN
jgi:hypothetical protein